MIRESKVFADMARAHDIEAFLGTDEATAPRGVASMVTWGP
jgi:hypothetical protein